MSRLNSMSTKIIQTTSATIEIEKAVIFSIGWHRLAMGSRISLRVQTDEALLPFLEFLLSGRLLEPIELSSLID